MTKEKLQELLEILLNEDESKSYRLFCERGEEFLSKEAVLSILSSEETVERKYLSLLQLGWIVGVNRMGPPSDSERRFDFPWYLVELRGFFNDWDVLMKLKIPFFEWEDIAQEGLKFLAKFIQQSRYRKVDRFAGYDEFMDLFSQRYKALDKSGRYEKEFSNNWGYL